MRVFFPSRFLDTVYSREEGRVLLGRQWTAEFLLLEEPLGHELKDTKHAENGAANREHPKYIGHIRDSPGSWEFWGKTRFALECIRAKERAVLVGGG